MMERDGIGLPESRGEARKSGARHYWTGQACKRGHIATRYVSTGDCVECVMLRNETVPAERKRTYRARWVRDNPEKQAASVKKHRAAHMDRIRLRQAAWAAKNRLKLREKARRRYSRLAASLAAKAREWRRNNPDRARSIKRRAHAKEAKSARHRINAAVRAAIFARLKGEKGGRKTWSLLGYSAAELMEHLSARFAPGMSWDNFGEWHIDHVIPLRAFNYERAEDIDFKRAWSLENLQPLWALDNLRKSGRLAKPFQPSLFI